MTKKLASWASRVAGRRKAVWGSTGRVGAALLLAVVVALPFAGCSQLRQGQAASYLIITSLTGSNGCSSGSSGGGSGTVMQSDVQCVINNVPTIVSDPGSATFQLALKDPGGDSTPTTPTSANYITLTQYHVDYSRSDGLNTQGVDVPYSFDGAITSTVTGTDSVGFTIVRVQAKEEAPLAAIKVNNIPITMIATVTFYGHDQTGRDVSASGSIEITFANFGT